MKILPNFVKTFKENIRDWKILILVIGFAPFFVYLMKLYLAGSGSSTYPVAILNLDKNGDFSKELISEWEKIKTQDGKSILKILPVVDRESAEKMIRNRSADIFITIPDDFSTSFRKYLDTKKGSLSALVSYGEQSNIKYGMAASFVDYAAFNYIGSRAGMENPMNIKYESAGDGKEKSDFDLYVPALFVLSIIMVLFTAGASIIREVEKETITRLSLSKLSSFEFMTALSMNQVLIGLAGLLFTLFAAFSVGYKTNGSIPLFLLIGVITCFSVIGIGIMTTCFIKNMFGLLTIGCFPFFILMFFSDCFMPLPKVNIIKLFGNQVYLNDILPTATATRALNKVLSYNSGFSDIQFELLWMAVLSCLYFGIGVFLFKKNTTIKEIWS
jgi:ABC-2 type transport system permease protein